MELLLAAYLIIAGVIGAGYKDGIVKDDTTVRTYQFEIAVAEKEGDTAKVAYLRDRLDRFEAAQ